MKNQRIPLLRDTFASTTGVFLGTVPEQWTPTKAISFIRKQEKSVSINC